MDILSLFTGIGGLDLGVCSALRNLEIEHRTLTYVEGEAFCVGVLAKAMEAGHLGAAPVWSDVRSFEPPPCDMLIAGFPCQGFSVAGKRNGFDHEKSGLWSEVVRIARDSGARLVFLENVPAIRTKGLRVVLEDLAGLGFDAEWGRISASAVGAPHRRDRWFCLAYRNIEGLEGGIRGPEAGGVEPSAESGVQQLADADRRRLEGLREPHRAEHESRDHPLRSHLFPPGPEDLEGWKLYLERRPDAEPSVRRGSDGLSSRVDKLRALGNAVVPQQAQAAFLELVRRVRSEPSTADRSGGL